MSERGAVEEEVQPDSADASDDALVARATKGRRAGADCLEDVAELLHRAAEQNRAALDRLAT
jgi:hypothetical protein